MSDSAVKLEQVNKYYKLYDSPKDRFKEALDPFRRQRYREFFALNHIDLDIKKGEILGVVGRNGCGKSTLLKLIAGVIPPSSGNITVNGAVSAMLELGSGLNPDLTGIQNIYFGGIMLGFSQHDMKDRVDEIIAFADIGNFINQPLKIYSSGMKARLGFALAVTINPDILVVDEVLSVGDDLFKRKCYARMEEFFKGGKTIVYVSHSVDSIVQLCKRVVLLDHGEILLEGPPKMVTMYYQKMLYSSKKDYPAVVEEMKNLNRNETRKENFEDCFSEVREEVVAEVKLPDGAERKKMNLTEANTKPYYLPDFISKTALEYRNLDVQITDVGIFTSNGLKVNVLVHGETYSLRYKVLINEAVTTLQHGNSIKTEKGQDISWFVYPAKGEFDEKLYTKGEVLFYCMSFDCLLLAGANYYINIGLRSLINGESIIAHRIVDAYVFKVISQNKTNGGIVSLNQKVII